MEKKKDPLFDKPFVHASLVKSIAGFVTTVD